MIPQSKIPTARGFLADMANLLFEPKEIAVMTIPTRDSSAVHHAAPVRGRRVDRPPDPMDPALK